MTGFEDEAGGAGDGKSFATLAMPLQTEQQAGSEAIQRFSISVIEPLLKALKRVNM